MKALVGRRAGTVGITTGLYGVGGFGKTTLAQMVCADRRVRRRFGDAYIWSRWAATFEARLPSQPK